jgi:hypothetical protein
MTKSNQTWRKSEGGVVGRFGDPRKALKSVALVFADDEVNPTIQSKVVDTGTTLKQLKMRLVPSVDLTHLSRIPDELQAALGITLILRDPAVKRFTLLESWPLDDLPETFSLDELPELERVVQDRIVLTVGLTALREEEGLEAGTTLARKDFYIHTDGTGNRFPHEFVDASYFVDRGLPKTTSWFVNMLSEDGDRSAEETFVVYINRELVEVASARGADAVWASIGADTFATLILRLLKGELPEEPPMGSVLHSLSRQLAALGLSIHDVGDWVRNSEISNVMAISQSIVKVNSLLRSAL